MVTTKLEPGVLFAFRHGELTLESRAKESGQSKATIPVTFNGTADFIFDIAYIREYLRALDAETAIDIYMTVDNDPVLFTIGDGNYSYLVMPMSREKTTNAKPKADTGIEVVGTESTMEEHKMEKIDERHCHDDYTDLQTRFFQLQMTNDQLHAKAEHYKTLLDRAMLVIEKMKSDQRVCV
jgi:hypothetical protein